MIALTDENGNVVARYNYGPWGETDIVYDDDGSGAANPIRYTGREMDETKLYYYRARYYSPQMGRFISEDPIGFEGGDVNLYSYTSNNPVNYTDNLGLSTALPSPSDERACYRVKFEHPEVWEPFDKPGQDKLQHCALACQITKEYGPWTAHNCALWKEVKDRYDRNPRSISDKADFQASMHGINIALTQDGDDECSQSDCVAACKKHYK